MIKWVGIFLFLLTTAVFANEPTPQAVPTTPIRPPSSSQIIIGAQSLGTSPGDLEVDEVTLARIPAMSVQLQGETRRIGEIISARLRAMMTQLDAENISPAGPPMALFEALSDSGFRAQLMIPIGTPPQKIPEGLTFTFSPQGSGVRIVHRGPYNEIDGSYEELSAFVEDRDIDVQDLILERYMTGLDLAANDAIIEVIVLKK